MEPLKYKFINNKYGYKGTYTVYNKLDKIVAETDGISIKQRFINYRSKTSELNIQIWQRPKRKFLFLREGNVYSNFQIKYWWTVSILKLRTHSSEIMYFISNDFTKTYTIRDGNGNPIGQINCDNWQTENIYLELSDVKNSTELICAVIALGFYRKTRFLSFLEK